MWFVHAGSTVYGRVNTQMTGPGMIDSQVSPSAKSADSSPMDALVRVTEADMEAVNTLILSKAKSHVEMVPAIARHLIDAGGKRLRPMLTLAVAQLVGATSGHQIAYAAALEFMHNATLLHDDVVDESEMRRGRPAARKIWGNQASVLVGDFLLGQAFMMMVDAGSLPALKVLSSAAAVIAEGEVLQLSVATNLNTSEDEYFEVIGAKTAALFEAATEVGAMAGEPAEADRVALALYGRELGVAFQLVDDVLDYGGAGGVLGKNTGDDLREGKMTLPIIVALKSATSDERALIAAALGDETVDAQRFGAVLGIVKRHNGLGYTLEHAHKHARAARAALDPLSASELKDILADMGDYCVGRAY